MNTIQERVRGAAATAGSALRRAVSWHGAGGRVRMIASAAAATVLAIGAGIWWGIASAEEPLDPSAAPPVATASDGPSGDTPSGSTASGAQAGGGDPAGGDNPAGGGGQPGGAGSGSGPGGGGTGGQPGNRAPVIEDPDLSSGGLTLTVKPTVTDPDGDEVTLRVIVDGEEAPNDADPEAEFVATVPFDHQEVGYTLTATVEIEATDSRGATTREAFSHDLAAVTTVTLRDVTFRVLRPQDCFRDEAARRVTGALLFTGPVTRTFSFDEELRADRPSVQLLGEDAGEVSGREAVQGVALVGGQFAGHFDVSDDRHRPTDTVSGSTIVASMFETSGDCESRFTYKIFFRIR